MIPEALVTRLLVKCGRCCCVCRRFEPLHLQIHHIIEKTDGGTDDEDNLIPLCLSCHSDVHTRTKLTRRFTSAELKEHRDLTYELVAQGRLPAGPPVSDPLLTFSAEAASAVIFPSSEKSQLSNLAIEILVKAASGDGDILMLNTFSGFHIRAGETVFVDGHDPRAEAEHRHAVSGLRDGGLIQIKSSGGTELFAVTHPGYLLADQLMGAGTERTCED